MNPTFPYKNKKMDTYRRIRQRAYYYIMNKCEHGERITTFCASDCCVWKQAAGCDTCMKKYHNHMGPTIFLSEEQVVGLVKKYMVDSSIKPKCRLLQQAIYAYLNQIKTQVAASIDVLCKNIINQIGYPFLYSNNTLSVYKRLKNKQYKKVVQKQFKTLYELSQKVNQKDLIKEETKIYQQQMKKTEELLHSLQEVMKKYQLLIKGCHNSFLHDSSCILKINDMMKSLHQDSKSSLKNQKVKEQRETSSSKQSLYSAIINREKEQSKKEEGKETKLLNGFQSKNSNSQAATARSPLISSPPMLARPNYSRDVSIDRKIVKERKFSHITPAKEKDQSQTETISFQSGEKQKEKQTEKEKQRSKQKQKEKIQSFRPEINSKEIQINQRKKMLIQMMKQKQDSLRIVKQRSIKETIDSKQPQQTKSKFQLQIPSFFKRQTSSKNNINPTTQSQRQNTSQGHAKSSNNESDENSNNQLQVQERLKSQENDVHIQAFTQLPFLEKQSKKQCQRQQVKQKVIFVPKSPQFQQMSANITEINSPIIKQLNKSYVFKPKEKEQTKQKQYKAIIREQQSRYQTYSSKRQQVLQLKENEQRSLALLMKSLTLNADEGIRYLQSALSQAQNNLSAAQYLTYLYLQQEKPQNCLHLCNKMLLKLEDSSEPQQLSLIINNNKAAALNILGRYSQAIYILQKCLRYREKDYLYKNLGDSYFSIAIYQKAIYNYQKALKINQCYDEAQYNLAVCLYIQQNYFNAKLAIKKALQMQPQNEAYLQLSFNIETRITHC